MAPADIRKIRQYATAQRIGEQNTGEDPFTQPDQNIPLGSSNQILQEVGDDPSFVRNNIRGAESQIGDDPTDRYRRWLDDYQPEHSASDRLNELIAHPPTRERPSLGRSLVAIGMGLGKGGFKDEQDVMNEPFDRKKDEWTTQTGPAYQAASIERQSNANERALRGNVIAAETAADRTASSEREANRRYDLQAAKNKSDAEIANRKLQILEDQSGDYTYDDKGEYLIAHNKKGESWNTGVPTSNFSPFELQKLRNAGNLAVQQSRNAGTLATKEATPGGYAGRSPGTASAEKPAEVKVRQANKAREILNADPEMAQFIKITGTNDFTMTPPKGGWFSDVDPAKKAKYDLAYEAIYGVKPSKLGGPPPAPGTTEEKKGPPIGGSNTPPPAAAKGPYIPGKSNYQEEYESNPQPDVPMYQTKEYPDVGPEQPANGPLERAAGVIAAHVNKPDETGGVNVYGQKPGYTKMRNTETGGLAWIPNGKVEQAVSDGAYAKVR